MVYLIAAAVLLFYFLCIPVNFALSIKISVHSALGAGASLFEERYALRSAEARARGEKKHWSPGKRKPEMQSLLPALWASASYLLPRLHLKSLRARGVISASDAASTALICGGVRMLSGSLAPLLPRTALDLNLKPDFSTRGSDCILTGMVCTRAGHIMVAALIGAWKYIVRSRSNGKTSD